MPVRKAEATWKGDLKSGKGTMKLGSGAYEGAYTFNSRFEDGAGSNPEELIGAALAGCYSMALSDDLAGAGYSPESVHATATVKLEMVNDKPTITNIKLMVVANVPDVEEDSFFEFAEAAKKECIIARALQNVTIMLDASLNNS